MCRQNVRVARCTVMHNAASQDGDQLLVLADLHAVRGYHATVPCAARLAAGQCVACLTVRAEAWLAAVQCATRLAAVQCAA